MRAALFAVGCMPSLGYGSRARRHARKAQLSLRLEVLHEELQLVLDADALPDAWLPDDWFAFGYHSIDPITQSLTSKSEPLPH